MWYDDPFVKFKKRKKNRRRKSSREPILMVNARMLEQRRERMHRMGTFLLFAVSAIGALWVTFQGGKFLGRVLFSENEVYAIRSFDIGSDGRRIPASLIQEYAQVSEGMNLFAVSLGDIRSRLEEVSLVQRADVSRILPDGLRIWVTERVAIARFDTGQSRYPLAVDRYGYVLGGRGARTPNLPVIVGTEPSRFRPGNKVEDQAVLDALHVLDVCDSDAEYSRIVHIKKVDVRHDDYLELTLDQSRVVQLGRESTIDRLGDLAATLQQSEAKGLNWRHGNFKVKKNQAIR